jgi:hypothetical protein
VKPDWTTVVQASKTLEHVTRNCNVIDKNAAANLRKEGS